MFSNVRPVSALTTATPRHPLPVLNRSVDIARIELDVATELTGLLRCKERRSDASERIQSVSIVHPNALCPPHIGWKRRDPLPLNLAQPKQVAPPLLCFLTAENQQPILASSEYRGLYPSCHNREPMPPFVAVYLQDQGLR